MKTNARPLRDYLKSCQALQDVRRLKRSEKADLPARVREGALSRNVIEKVFLLSETSPCLLKSLALEKHRKRQTRARLVDGVENTDCE